jgi:hypothetical protein
VGVFVNIPLNKSTGLHSVDRQHGRYGHGHAAWAWAQHGRGHTAWTWAHSMNMNTQHGHGHAAWVWTRSTDMCCMDMDIKHLDGDVAWTWTMQHEHGQGNAEWTWTDMQLGDHHSLVALFKVFHVTYFLLSLEDSPPMMVTLTFSFSYISSNNRQLLFILQG